jgi:hypothetical protein
MVNAKHGSKSRFGNWLTIISIIAATAVFSVLGTMNPSLRYDLIGV